jgi:t-SNARE complex subunit (syntaxin)
MKPANLNPAFMEILKDAGRAPSGHNTQPWKFRAKGNQLIIRPDFDRRLKVVDADDHALFISLGCALENLTLSAKAHHFKPSETTNFVDDKNEIIVDLIETEGIEKDLLYDFIQSRQCTRTGYDDTPIDESLLEELIESAKNEVVEIIYITDKNRIKELEPFIIEASNLQFNNQQFVNELVNWFRFSRKIAEEKRDGLWTASMGLPNMPKPIGNFIMKNFVSAKSEAKRWKNLINQSAGFALFVIKENSKENWVKLGQSFERFCLKATQLNIKHAHVNMPCEEITVRQKLIKHFKLRNGKQPLLLIRLGYAEAMPYSYRLLLDEVLFDE